MSKSDIIDITVQLHAETEKAIAVSDNGDSNRVVWLPKSQIEFEAKKGSSVGIVEVSLPEWLAMDKGLI